MAEKKKVKVGLGAFDMAKGIAVLGVIIFHMRARYFSEEMMAFSPLFMVLFGIGSSLIPMFFIISGYGFMEKKPAVVFKKTFSSMILPYLVCIPLVAVSFLAFSYPAFYPREEFLKRFWGLMAGLALGLPENKLVGDFQIWAIVTMWFFLALFVAQNLLNLIVKVKKIWLQILLVGLCIAVGFVLRAFEFDYYCIALGLLAVGFCYAGYAIKKWKLLNRWMYSPWAWICLGILFLPQFFTGFFNMASGEYSPLKYFSAGCGGVLMMFAALWCNRFNGRITGALRKIGFQSFWVIYVHGIERLALPWDALAWENPSLLLALVIEVGLKIVFISLGCMVFKKISQIKYRRLTGKSLR